MDVHGLPGSASLRLEREHITACMGVVQDRLRHHLAQLPKTDCAAALAPSSLTESTRVVVCAPALGVLEAILVLTLHKLQAVLCLIDSRDPPHRQAAVLQDFQPHLVLHHHTRPPPATETDSVSTSNDRRGRRRAAPAAAKTQVDTAWQPVWIGYDTELFGCHSCTPAGLAARLGQLLQPGHASRAETQPASSPLPNPGAISHVFYTSGSTGVPKGCVVSRAAVDNYIIAKRRRLGTDETSVVLLASGIAFDPGMLDILATWHDSARLAIWQPGPLLGQLSHVLSATRATHVLTTPVLWATLDTTVAADPASFPCLRVVALGGEAMPSALIDIWAPRVQLFNIYGVTECCGYQTAGQMRGGLRHEGRRLGAPLDGNQLGIIPAGNGDILLLDATADGRIVLNAEATESASSSAATPPKASPARSPYEAPPQGELCISGSQVGRGYLNRPDSTTQAYLTSHDGQTWYRTGDILRWQAAEQSYCLLGRRDFQVKIRGNRVQLDELEHTVQAELSSLVQSCFAAYGQQQLVLWFRLHNPSDEGRTDCARLLIASLLRQRLPTHMQPHRVEPVMDWPLTSNGKVSRRQLTEDIEALPPLRLATQTNDGDLLALPLAESEFDADNHADELATETNAAMLTARTWLADAVQETLGLSQRPPLALSFIELGGDSLSALRVVLALRRVVAAANTGVNQESADSSQQHLFGENLEAPFFPQQLLSHASLLEYANDLVPLIAGAEHPSSTHKAPIASCPAATSETRQRRVLRAILAGDVAEALEPWFRMQASPTPTSDAPTGIDSTAVVQQACIVGSSACVTVLLESDPSLMGCRTASGDTLLHLAARTPAVSLLKKLLDRPRAALLCNDDGQTALHVAARAGAGTSVIELLVAAANEVSGARGNGVNISDRWGRTPLHWAVQNGHLISVQALLQHGAQARAEDAQGETPLAIAERRAQCRAQRPDGLRPSVFGAIATALGGSGKTQRLDKSS